MNKVISLFCIFLICICFPNPSAHYLHADEPVAQGSDVFVDYQNYRHGYCPYCDCNPCKCGKGPTYVGPIAPPPPPKAVVPPPMAEPAVVPAGGPPASCATGKCGAPPCATGAYQPLPPVEGGVPPASPACASGACAVPPPDNSCAPVCGTACGISVCALGVAIAAVATAAVLIVSSGNGSVHNH